MAKPSLTTVSVTQTFQTWLDKTNDIVELLQSDVMTASALGDTTSGNATLVGTFTANNVIAHDLLRTNEISPRSGFTNITASAPIIINSSSSIAQTLNSLNGPKINFSSGSVIWRSGFEDTTENNFIIDTGTGTRKLKLTPTGDLTVAGSITATGDLTVAGSITATGDLTVAGSITASSFTGNVIGQVSDISNHNTDELSEGGGNLYFTNARARAAISVSGALSYNSGTGVISITNSGIRGLFSGGTGITYSNTTGSISITNSDIRALFSAGTGVTYADATGVISIGQSVGKTSSVSFKNLNTSGSITSIGAITSRGDITAFASSSDVRKKENIIKIDNALEKVLSVSGYTYNFIGDDRKITGVIAQEIEKVLPEAVYEIDDESFGSKTKAVRYGNIVGLLIEAIKDLNAEINELKNGS
jgi:hypothetical protein